jgi:hypothetical protein
LPGLFEVATLTAPNQQSRQEHGHQKARNESVLQGSWLREPEASQDQPCDHGGNEDRQSNARWSERVTYRNDQPSQPVSGSGAAP